MQLARVPGTQSLAVTVGEALPVDDFVPFADMTDDEIDRLVLKCRRALASHRRDSRSRNAGSAADALAAIETIKGTLKELVAIAPPEKRAKINALIESA
jgi:hypothetical protein